MRIYIAVDCEGGACVVGDPGLGLESSRGVAAAKAQMSRETAAAVSAAFTAGATQVVVWDNHCRSENLDYDLLDPRCEIALGQFTRRFPELDASFDTVLLLGYHARDNTPDAVLAHTFSSTDISWMRLGDQEVGEIAIDAAIAGERGVPALFISSCDKGCAEAQAVLPWIRTVATKRSHARNAAVSLHPRRACEDIARVVTETLGAMPSPPPVFTFPTPIIHTVCYKRMETAAQQVASGDFQALDAYTVQRRLDSIDAGF